MSKKVVRSVRKTGGTLREVFERRGHADVKSSFWFHSSVGVSAGCSKRATKCVCWTFIFTGAGSDPVCMLATTGRNVFCNNGLTRDAGAWHVSFPETGDNVSGDLLPLDEPPPLGPHAAAKADVARGELKTSVAGRDPYPHLSYAVAEASIFDKISFEADGMRSGDHQPPLAQVRFMIDGVVKFAYGSVIMAEFSIRDGSQAAHNPDNPDAPASYLLYYPAE